MGNEDRRARVVARYRQALVMPPRRLVPYVEKLEKDFAVAKARVKSALEAFGRTKDKGTIPTNELLGKLDFEIGSLRWDKLREPIERIDDGFYYFQQKLKENQSTDPESRQFDTGNVRIMDSVTDFVVKPLRAMFLAQANPLLEAAEKTSPEAIRQVLASNEDFRWNEQYEEGVHPEVINALGVLHEQLQQLVDLLHNAFVRIEAFSTRDVKPEKVETLYHASVKARQIHEGGFKAEVPSDQLGLGGSQTGGHGYTGISFTYDLKAALEISRSFKESAMIATGEVKASDVLDWGAHDIDMKHFLMWLKVKLGDSWTSPKVEHNGQRWIVKSPDKEGKVVEKDIDEALSRPIDVFNVYDAFLWAHPTRLNPVHMNRARLLEYLKNADPKDIGVVAAEVEMTHPGVISMPGEREFRVPPAAVIKVTRFYS